MADGFFRSKQGYTVVQNVITRDKRMSLKAKGLYLVIQSSITLPGKKWLKSEFMNMVSEGKTSFDSAWNELKRCGYLHVHIYSDGRSFTYEYELLNEPDDGPHTFYYNASGVLTSTKSEDGVKSKAGKNAKDRGVSRDTDFRGIGNRDTENQGIGNQDIGNREMGNRDMGNRDANNKSLDVKPNILNLNNNQSIPSYQVESPIPDQDMIEDVIDDSSACMQLIRENIEYDYLMSYKDPEKIQRYDEMYQLICDVVCVNRDKIRINGEEYPYQLVKSQFLKLKREHLEYVAECMQKNYSKVTNIRAYLITVLYNAPSTIGNFEAQDYRAENKKEYKSGFDYEQDKRLERNRRLTEEGVPLSERMAIWNEPVDNIE